MLFWFTNALARTARKEEKRRIEITLSLSQERVRASRFLFVIEINNSIDEKAPYICRINQCSQKTEKS